MVFFTGSSVLLKACSSLIEKSSFFSGGNPRTRRVNPVSSSLASASLVLSFTLTRTSESLLAEKYLLNAARGIAAIESQLNKPRKVPCRVFTPTTLNNCPLINTDLSIGLWEGKSASATSSPITTTLAPTRHSSSLTNPPDDQTI